MTTQNRWSHLRKVIPLLLMAGLFWAGFTLGTQHSPAEAGSQRQGDREELFAPFWETWDLLHSSYVEPLDDNTLMEGALNGMMETLGDDHSFYMDPETFAMVNNDLQGEFEGIGASVRQNQETGALMIVDTLPGSPAEEAGLVAGDAVVQVDGVDVTTMTQSEIVSRIRGAAGTQVSLGIIHPGESAVQIVRVTRARIEIDSVQAEVLDNGIVYIQLLQFGSETAQDLREVLIDLDVEHQSGLILDFRGNPGGFLSSAIDVASEFMSEGVVVTERFREGEQSHEVRGDPSAPTVPMVVLVNEGSASGSELVAAALQDNDRAVIVGETTYGKGSVQTWQPLSNGGGVRVTIALWYTPDGHTIQEVGLRPDVVVSQDEANAAEDDPQLEAAIQALTATVGIPQH